MESVRNKDQAKKLAIRVVSDTHHEFRDDLILVKPFAEDVKKTHTTICIMSGDIGHPFQQITKSTSKEPAINLYRLFLRFAKKNFDYVLVVSGNHEYYNKSTKPRTIEDFIESKISKKSGLKTKNYTIEDVDKEIGKICKEENCIYLNRKAVKIGNIFFIGCTLWANIPNYVRPSMWRGLNDLKYIYNSSGPLTINDYNKLHCRDLKYIIDTLNEIRKSHPITKVVVITHHAPSSKMNPEKYLGSALSKSYYTNLEHLLDDQISVWINGHTHLVREIEINDVRLVSNCYGYDLEENGYNPKFSIFL